MVDELEKLKKEVDAAFKKYLEKPSRQNRMKWYCAHQKYMKKKNGR